MGKVFISYRRDDVPGDARTVHDALVSAYGKKRVFMDVNNLQAGQRFDHQIGRELQQTDLLLAVMGPRWTELLDQRVRTGDPDYVRREIAEALQLGIPVIPVRVGREGSFVPLPRPDQLPPDIQHLILHQKIDIAHEKSARDLDELVKAVGKAAHIKVHAFSWRTVSVIAAAMATTAAVAWFGVSKDGFGIGSAEKITEHGPRTFDVKAGDPKRFYLKVNGENLCMTDRTFHKTLTHGRAYKFNLTFQNPENYTVKIAGFDWTFNERVDLNGTEKFPMFEYTEEANKLKGHLPSDARLELVSMTDDRRYNVAYHPRIWAGEDGLDLAIIYKVKYVPASEPEAKPKTETTCVFYRVVPTTEGKSP